MTAKAWERVLAQLRGEVSEQVFETWLRPLRFVAREGPILFVATPHKFFKEWIEENHLARIEEIARKELAEEVTVARSLSCCWPGRCACSGQSVRRPCSGR